MPRKRIPQGVEVSYEKAQAYLNDYQSAILAGNKDVAKCQDILEDIGGLGYVVARIESIPNKVLFLFANPNSDEDFYLNIFASALRFDFNELCLKCRGGELPKEFLTNSITLLSAGIEDHDLDG